MQHENGREPKGVTQMKMTFRFGKTSDRYLPCMARVSCTTFLDGLAETGAWRMETGGYSDAVYLGAWQDADDVDAMISGALPDEV